MTKLMTFSTAILLSTATLSARPQLRSQLVPLAMTSSPNQIELKNDDYNEGGGQAYLQQGFVSGEKAGVWVQVPTTLAKFKIDAFRVLIGNGASTWDEVFFQMGIAGRGQYSPAIPAEIENAAQVTPGAYWNDIPAQGANGGLRCAKGGELIGAAIEFTHDGLPSIYSTTHMSNPKANTLFAIPGGWNYSVAYGLHGDWILRIVGHAAGAGECP